MMNSALPDEMAFEYNLSQNDVNLMKGVLFCYFKDENELLSFSILNNLVIEYRLYLASPL